jgi:hypothetical protein
MKRLILVICLLLIALMSLGQNTEVPVKKIKSSKEYTIPICSKSTNDCFGYLKTGCGPEARVSSILIKDCNGYFFDQLYQRIVKLDLNSGKIVGYSKKLQEENIACIGEGFIEKDSMYFLSSCTGVWYKLSANLSIDTVTRLSHGMITNPIRINDTIFVIQLRIKENGDTLWFTGHFISEEQTVSQKLISISKSVYYEDTLIYGENVSLLKTDSSYFLKTNRYLYEIPELIPGVDEYYRPIGYSDKYLVYFVLQKRSYRIVILHY